MDGPSLTLRQSASLVSNEFVTFLMNVGSIRPVMPAAPEAVATLGAIAVPMMLSTVVVQ